MTETRRGIIIIAMANGLVTFGYGLSLPFFAVYLSTQKGVPASLVGTFLAFAMLSTSVASAISGEISDVIGRQKVMVGSVICRCISMFALAVCMYWEASFVWLLVFHFMGSFLGAFFRPAANAWIADNTTPKERVEAFGINRIGLNLGWALGPAIGGFMVLKSYDFAFFSTAFAYLGGAFFVFKYIKDSRALSKARKANFASMLMELKNPCLAQLCLFIFLITMVNSQLVVGLSLHTVTYLGLPQNYVGLFFTMNGLVVVFFQYFASMLMTKMRLTTAIAIGCFMYAVGYGSVGFFKSFGLIGAGVILAAFGELLVSPGEHTLVANIASPTTRGRFLGLQTVFYQLGSSFGIFSAGMLMEYVSPAFLPGPWLIIGFIAVLAGVGFLSIRRYLTDEQDGKTNVPVPLKKDTTVFS